MKRLALLALAMLAAPGCAEEDPGVRLLGARPLDETCTPESVQRAGGSFNINSPAGGYIIAFNIESVRDTTENSVNGAPVSDSRSHDFISSELVQTFESTPSLGLTEVRTPYTFVLRAGAGQDSFIAVDLLPSATLAVLDAHFASGGAPVTLLVTTSLAGEFASGKEAETNAMTYPITVFAGASAPTCAVGKRLALNGPCGGPPGQDGIPYVCEDDPNAT